MRLVIADRLDTTSFKQRGVLLECDFHAARLDAGCDGVMIKHADR